jgi:hypothetical protein
MGLIEWLWRFLPDRCEMPGCSRQGVRGNENVIRGKRVCDYCHAIIGRVAQQDRARSPLRPGSVGERCSPADHARKAAALPAKKFEAEVERGG